MKFNKLLVALIVSLSTILITATSWSATISGNVTYSGVSTGRVYLLLMKLEVPQGSLPGTPPSPVASGFGTSVAWTAPGPVAYSISGIDQPGNYTIHAFMDASIEQTGFANGLSPIGSAGYPDPLVIVDSSTQLSGTTVAIDEQPYGLPQAVTCNGQDDCNVNQFDSGLVFSWTGPTNSNGIEIADSYNVYWSTSPSVGPGQVQPPGEGGMATKPAKFDDNHYIITGLDPAKQYYVAVEAVLDGVVSPLLSSAVEGNMSWPPVAPTGSGSVTGNVVFSGPAPSAPLLMIASSDTGGEYFAYFQTPTATHSFSITGLAPGTYNIMALYDADNSHYVSKGDLGNFNSEIKVTIPPAGGSVALPYNITLAPAPSLAKVTTNMNYGQNGAKQYSLQFKFQSQEKQIANVLLTDYPGGALPEPISVSFNEWGEMSYQASDVSRPIIGDNYSGTIFYTDGTSAPGTVEITGLIDTLPDASFPSGQISGSNRNLPTFSWNTSSALPQGDFSYFVQLQNQFSQNGDNNTIWSAVVAADVAPVATYDVSSSSTVQPLLDGSNYNWNVTIVDRFGNQAQTGSQFTPTANGPSISSLSTTISGLGTSIQINGSGFDTQNLYNNFVSFNGYPGTVTAATAGNLTVTLPTTATQGLISVSVNTNGNLVSTASPSVFYPTTGFDSFVVQNDTTHTNTAFSGVIVQRYKPPTKALIPTPVTTADNGNYKFTGVRTGGMQYQGFTPPDTGTHVKAYSARMMTFSNYSVGTTYAYKVYGKADRYETWGSTSTGGSIAATSGKGVIYSSVYNNSNQPIADAEVRAFSTKYGTTNHYIVAYEDPAFTPLDTSKLTYGPGTRTSSNGRFFIMNVDPDDIVVVTAVKSGYYFNMRTYDTYADSVMQGRISGQAIPTISGFSPQSGVPGDTITINGTNFSSSSNQVCFNSYCTSANYNSTGEVRAILPCGAQSGPLSVIVNGLTATAATNFTVPAPTISGFTPSQGPVGATVTITGTNFTQNCGPPYGMSVNFYNNIYTSVTVNSTIQMTVLVPFNASTGPISANNYIGTATGNTFTVLPPPGMSTAAPNGGPPGTTITVSGVFYDLDQNNYEVSFNGSPRDVITGVTANSLTFTAPSDISTYSTYVVKYYGQQYFIFNSFALWNLLTMNIVGMGSVNDVPGSNFNCTSGDPQPCTKYFDPTTLLNLTPSTSTGYIFQAWDAGCIFGNGPNDCSFNMSSPTTRTVTFSIIERLKNETTATPYYTVQAAFDVAENNNKIWLQSFATVGVYNEYSEVVPLVFNRPGVISKVRGGWNGTYDPSRTTDDFSIVSGPLKIQQGTLQAEQLKVRP